MKSAQSVTTSSISQALRAVIKRRHYPLEIMLTCVRWYVAYPLSLRHIEEMMTERGVHVDHATVHRWSIKILPVLAAVFRTRKRQVGGSWRMDETYILISGSGSISTGRWTPQGKPSTFCSATNAMQLLHVASWRMQLDCTASRRRFALTAAPPTKRPCKTSKLQWANP